MFALSSWPITCQTNRNPPQTSLSHIEQSRIESRNSYQPKSECYNLSQYLHFTSYLFLSKFGKFTWFYLTFYIVTLKKGSLIPDWGHCTLSAVRTNQLVDKQTDRQTARVSHFFRYCLFNPNNCTSPYLSSVIVQPSLSLSLSLLFATICLSIKFAFNLIGVSHTLLH